MGRGCVCGIFVPTQTVSVSSKVTNILKVTKITLSTIRPDDIFVLSIYIFNFVLERIFLQTKVYVCLFHFKLEESLDISCNFLLEMNCKLRFYFP